MPTRTYSCVQLESLIINIILTSMFFYPLEAQRNSNSGIKWEELQKIWSYTSTKIEYKSHFHLSLASEPRATPHTIFPGAQNGGNLNMTLPHCVEDEESQGICFDLASAILLRLLLLIDPTVLPILARANFQKGCFILYQSIASGIETCSRYFFMTFVEGWEERSPSLPKREEHSGIFLSKEPLLCFTLSRVRFAVSLMDKCSYWILRAWPCS